MGDVEILCTSSSGRVVGCQTSSILLSAYSSVLRRSFNCEEENSVLFCQDFSEESVRAVLDFLTYGSNIIMDLRLVSEVHAFLEGLSITDGFDIDGFQTLKNSTSISGSTVPEVKLSNVSGTGLAISLEEIKPEIQDDFKVQAAAAVNPDVAWSSTKEDLSLLEANGCVGADVDFYSDCEEEYKPLAKKRKRAEAGTKTVMPSATNKTKTKKPPKKKKKKNPPKKKKKKKKKK